MQYIQNYFMSFWEMTLLMHGYIIFGLLVAGVIREFISDDYIRKNLGGRGLWPSVKAALLGLPLPLCSCSVIPLAASLRKSGAGKGAVTSFFISTPMTGADSIIATYGVFGWVITLFRVVSASLAAIIAGFVTDIIYKDQNEPDGEPVIKEGGCCTDSCCSSAKPEKATLAGRIKNIFRYAFADLLGDIAYPLLVGLFLAALITMIISPDMAGSDAGIVTGYLIAFAVGIPLYVCSISAIPIAMSLLIAGFSPGAAFVFLAGAPATNIVALNIVKNMLGKRGLLIYLVSIVFFTLIFALAADLLYFRTGLSFADFSGEEESFNGFTALTAGIFLAVTGWISFKQKVLGRIKGDAETNCCS